MFRRLLNSLVDHAHMNRAAKATMRFLLVIGGLCAFAVSFVLQYRVGDVGCWTALGLLLVCLAALFYDPENPPNQSAFPVGDEDA